MYGGRNLFNLFIILSSSFRQNGPSNSRLKSESTHLFGVAVPQLTSITPARWSSQDIAISQNFTQQMRESCVCVAARSRLSPRLDITILWLMQSLDIVRFSNICNANLERRERLGPILEAKIRHQLQDFWNDVLTLLHVLDAVRTSLRKTRAQTTSIARSGVEKNSEPKVTMAAAPRLAGKSTKSDKRT